MDLGLLGRCDGLELSCANQKCFLAKKKPGHNPGKQTALWLENPTIFSRCISLISLKPQWVFLLSKCVDLFAAEEATSLST